MPINKRRQGKREARKALTSSTIIEKNITGAISLVYGVGRSVCCQKLIGKKRNSSIAISKRQERTPSLLKDMYLSQPDQFTCAYETLGGPPVD